MTNQIAQLTHGECRYRIDGPEDGARLLLIHGATVPMWEFDRIAPLLHTAGFRTLRADLYGHGLSARPHTEYRIDLFAAQMQELLDEVGWESAMVLGHSLGSAVAARMAALEPGRVTRIVMSAPLVDFTANVNLAGILKLPLVGELMIHAVMVPGLRKRRARRYGDIECGQFVTQFDEQLAKPGFGRALLSMFRAGTLGCQRHLYRAIRERAPDVLVLRGDLDTVMTADQFDETRSLLPGARFEQLVGCGHPKMLTHPEMVAPLVGRFLSS